MEITPWHKLAQIFLNKELDLPEIGKAMMISTAVGLIPKEPDAMKIAFNVLDNSELYEALVLGLLNRQPSDRPISYRDMAMLVGSTPRVIGAAVNRLIDKGEISKEDRGRLGSFFTIHHEKQRKLPVWVREFTAALIDLHNDPEFKAQVIEECKEIGFLKGFEVLRKELRDKFYRPSEKQPK